ncbi:TRAP transporter small permease subunit [Desulfoferrobacter suflitae]|uniref:TRAP transporter small permease subunit n=1 Tax=Desulfoferrobacter suflitae TaxID=2865782 RepID=UPI002164D3F8|nr:TRAP transporter small permease subunit [Desulfoferrobacter suflitae]MCK8603405.1 TRAP transporter small permease subunit [Desulfoferrobacter suflitae]
MWRITKIVGGIDRLNQRVGRAVSWLSGLMVVVVTVDVVMRYLFRTSYVFVQELEWHLFGALFLLGAGYTLLHDAHVRVDIFYQRLTARQQAWVDLLGTLLFLLPGCILVISTSWEFFINSWSIGEGSPDPGGIPARYILKAVIPIGFFLVALQGISLALKSLTALLGYSLKTDEEEAL